MTRSGRTVAMLLVACACGVELFPTSPGGKSFTGTSMNPQPDGGIIITFDASVAIVGEGEHCGSTANCDGALWCSTATSNCTACGSGESCEDGGVCLARSCSHGAVGEACRSSGDCRSGLTCSNSRCATSSPLCPVYSVSVVTSGGVAWFCTDGASGEPCNMAIQCNSGVCDTDGGTYACR